jgi:hypothetical protein
MPHACKAGAADVRQLSPALAAAFYDDPPGKWFFPDDRRRKARLERWFSLALHRLYLRHGAC